MRSIFDQYTQPENQLTHGLICCLDQDRKLLKHFLLFAAHRENTPGLIKHIFLELFKDRISCHRNG